MDMHMVHQLGPCLFRRCLLLMTKYADRRTGRAALLTSFGSPHEAAPPICDAAWFRQRVCFVGHTGVGLPDAARSPLSLSLSSSLSPLLSSLLSPPPPLLLFAVDATRFCVTSLLVSPRPTRQRGSDRASWCTHAPSRWFRLDRLTCHGG